MPTQTESVPAQQRPVDELAAGVIGGVTWVWDTGRCLLKGLLILMAISLVIGIIGALIGLISGNPVP